MSILVNRADGTVSLNDRENFLRLAQEGDVSSISTSNSSSDGTVYNYEISLPAPVANNAFLLFIKSDGDKISRIEKPDFSSSTMTFKFTSTSDVQKKYIYFAPYSFDSYTANTSFGAKVFNSSGTVMYDSRIEECIFRDSALIKGPGTTSSHVATTSAWYSINTFPIGFSYESIAPTALEGGYWSYQQISDTTVEVSRMKFVTTVPDTFPQQPFTQSSIPDSNIILLEKN